MVTGFSDLVRLLCLLLVLLATPASATTLLAKTDHFELHSDVWLNLHHFLYQWARAKEGLGEGRQAVEIPEQAELDSLPEGEQASWNLALLFYRAEIARRNHLSDEMLGQNVELLKCGGHATCEPVSRIKGVHVALQKALPIYLARWWPRHREANARWVEDLVPRLDAHEEAFAELAAHAYGTDWPGEPIRVDVSAYANFRAGYTALGHTVMYTTDPGNQDWYAFEMLLHETQHLRSIAGAGRREFRKAFADADRRAPANLWHALLFVASGEFTARVVEEQGGSHTSYWEREGFRDFSGWQQALALAEEYWRPVISGESTREAAFAAFVAATE